MPTNDKQKLNPQLFVGVVIIFIAIGIILLNYVLVYNPPPLPFIPSPTPFHSGYPEVTYTPKTTPVEIAVLNLVSEIQPDGSVLNKAELSIAPIGLGSIRLKSPRKMKLNESRTIRLTIAPNSALMSLPKSTLSPLSSNEPNTVLQIRDNIQIFPVMKAELIGVNFDIESDGSPEKPVISSSIVEWIWTITPKDIDKQTLELIISIPVIIDHSRDIISAKPIDNIPIEIIVEGRATLVPTNTSRPTITPQPTKTPTPIPIPIRIGNKLIENSGIIVVSILGLIGVIFTAYASIQNTKRQNDVEELKEKLEKSIQDKEELEQKIDHLESIPWWMFWGK